MLEFILLCIAVYFIWKCISPKSHKSFIRQIVDELFEMIEELRNHLKEKDEDDRNKKDNK